MSSPGRKIVSQSRVSVTTRRFRTTTPMCSSFPLAYGPIWLAFTSGTSTSRATRRTMWRRRSTSQSRRSELTRPNKKAVALAAAILLDEIIALDLLGERRNRRRFVVFDVEDGVQLGDLQQIVDFLGQVQQLQFAAAVLDRREGADQFTDARAVDVADVAQVQEDLL